MATIKEIVPGVSVHDVSEQGPSQRSPHGRPASSSSASSSDILAISRSTRLDTRDMARMGHKQQLIRHYSLWKSTAFVCVAMVSWELIIFTLNAGLVGGGRAGLIWSFIWNFVGFAPVFISMAECASIAPIAGSQYHWVSEFCSERLQRSMSYFTGWMSILAWQAGNAQGFLLTGQLIQAVVQIQYPDYVPQAYHATLLTIAISAMTFVTNFYGNKVIPKLQNIMFVGHFALFVILIVSVGVMSPKATASQVWLEFEAPGGWSPVVLGVLAGQVSAISGNTGADTAGHIAEEVEDASWTVPRTMLLGYLANGAFGISIVIMLCYAMPDLGAALADPTTQPAIYVLRQFMSEKLLITFLSFTILILYCGNVNYMVAVSRDLWAFARDGGLPFSRLLAGVSRTRHIPTAAVAASCLLSGILSILYIGSATAYYAIVSLYLVAILQCYLLTIGSLLWRRIFHPATLPASRFSLGRWGIPTNLLALVWVAWSFFWSFWPASQPVTAANMNWASALFGAVLLFALVMYFASARKTYRGPVHLVAGRKGNAELDEELFKEDGAYVQADVESAEKA